MEFKVYLFDINSYDINSSDTNMNNCQVDESNNIIDDVELQLSKYIFVVGGTFRVVVNAFHTYTNNDNISYV